MTENPFLEIAERLSRIEHCLIDLRQQSEGDIETSNPVDAPLTVLETANYLNLAVPTIYTKVSKRELPFMKRGKRLYFSKLELSEYLKAGRKSTNEEILESAGQYVIQRNRRS